MKWGYNMLLIIDTETTGTDPGEVIELAYKEPSGPCTTRRYRPEKASSWGALAVHHILPDELIGCPPSTTAKLPDETQYIIGHNVDFDWKVLGSPDVKRICTLAIARALFPELDSHKLGAMYYALKGPTEATRTALRDAHTAEADVMFCEEILSLMLELRAPNMQHCGVQALWEFSEACRIPKTMTFGKHKGLPIKQLPLSYVAWMRGQPDMDEYVMKAIALTFGARR